MAKPSNDSDGMNIDKPIIKVKIVKVLNEDDDILPVKKMRYITYADNTTELIDMCCWERGRLICEPFHWIRDKTYIPIKKILNPDFKKCPYKIENAVDWFVNQYPYYKRYMGDNYNGYEHYEEVLTEFAKTIQFGKRDIKRLIKQFKIKLKDSEYDSECSKCKECVSYYNLHRKGYYVDYCENCDSDIIPK